VWRVGDTRDTGISRVISYAATHLNAMYVCSASRNKGQLLLGSTLGSMPCYDQPCTSPTTSLPTYREMGPLAMSLSVGLSVRVGMSLAGRLGGNANVCSSPLQRGWCRERPLPASTEVGDVVVIDCCGAYGRSMASTYNLRPVPVEVVVNGRLESD
jgi:hypothetical protein